MLYCKEKTRNSYRVSATLDPVNKKTSLRVTRCSVPKNKKGIVLLHQSMVELVFTQLQRRWKKVNHCKIKLEQPRKMRQMQRGKGGKRGKYFLERKWPY
ncbi:hypothetical protein ABFA07_017118 [Porites harrisoni]